jgi:O-antigen/teichoic acid export membrane protein
MTFAPVVRGLRTPLYRNALALLVNSGVTSLIGVAYWTLAARLTTAEVVGLNAALISVVVALASLSHLGLEDLVAVNVGMSLTVEGAHTRDELPAMFRRVLLRTLTLVGLIVGFGVLAAPLVLTLFGAGYANASVGALRLLLLGSLFRVVITLAICAARAERRPSRVIALQVSLR